MKKIPSKLLIEDYSNLGFDFIILYAWEYLDGTQDTELKEYKTDLSELEYYFNSLEWNTEQPFAEFWDNAPYPSKLDFLYLFAGDPKNGVIQHLVETVVTEIFSLVSSFAIAS